MWIEILKYLSSTSVSYQIVLRRYISIFSGISLPLTVATMSKRNKMMQCYIPLYSSTCFKDVQLIVHTYGSTYFKKSELESFIARGICYINTQQFIWELIIQLIMSCQYKQSLQTSKPATMQDSRLSTRLLQDLYSLMWPWNVSILLCTRKSHIEICKYKTKLTSWT